MALGFAWDEIEVALADLFADDEASDEPDPVEEEWRGVNCADCGQPMSASDNDVVESLTIETRGRRVLHWHPGCWVNPTSDTTRDFHKKAGWMQA